MIFPFIAAFSHEKPDIKKTIIYYFSDYLTKERNNMPTLNIERPRLSRDMRDALKRHILRERQKKKEEADANEADKQRRRAEKVIFKLLFSICITKRQEREILMNQDVRKISSRLALDQDL